VCLRRPISTIFQKKISRTLTLLHAQVLHIHFVGYRSLCVRVCLREAHFHCTCYHTHARHWRLEHFRERSGGVPACMWRPSTRAHVCVCTNDPKLLVLPHIQSLHRLRSRATALAAALALCRTHLHVVSTPRHLLSRVPGPAPAVMLCGNSLTRSASSPSSSCYHWSLASPYASRPRSHYPSQSLA